MIRLRSVVIVVLIALVLLYALFCWRMYVRQRDFLFPGQFLQAPALAATTDTELSRLSLPFGEVPILYRAAASPAQPTLLFFHGNAEFIGGLRDVTDGAARLGWGLLRVEYPGYGDADGQPSEQTLDQTAQSALDWLRTRVDADAKVIAMGRSIGTGIAARLARRNALPGLILQSPYRSTMALAWRFNAPGFLVRDRYDNEAELRGFRGAVLISHGRRDALIDFSHGEALAALRADIALLALDCGHNDCPTDGADYWQRVADWATRHQLHVMR